MLYQVLKMAAHSTLITVLLAGFLCLHSTNSAQADGKKLPETQSEKVSSVNPSIEQIAEWIIDLDSNSPEERQQAAQKLQQAGEVVINPITKAAETRNPELSTQCMELLKSLFESKDAKTKSAAATALKNLEKSKFPQVAKRAKEITQKPVQPRQGQRIFGGPIQIRVIARPGIAPDKRKAFKKVVEEDGKTIEISKTPGKEIVVKITEKVDGKVKVTEIKAKNIVELRKKNKAAYDYYRKHKPKNKPQRGAFRIIGVPQIAGNGNRVTIKTTVVNGKRTIEVDDNGKKVVITDENKKNITIKITEKIKGVEKTIEVQAKDLEELKKKNPTAAKEYEKYDRGNAGGNNIQIQIQGFQGLPIKIIPGALPQQNNLPAKQAKELQEQIIKLLQKQIQIQQLPQEEKQEKE